MHIKQGMNKIKKSVARCLKKPVLQWYTSSSSFVKAILEKNKVE
jgi:hypothetical protein